MTRDGDNGESVRADYKEEEIPDWGESREGEM